MHPIEEKGTSSEKEPLRVEVKPLPSVNVVRKILASLSKKEEIALFLSMNMSLKIKTWSLY